MSAAPEVQRSQRAMNDNADFIAKLHEIEQLAKTRAQHIAILARSLRARLEFGNLSVPKPPG